MKSFEELYKEIKANEDLRKEFVTSFKEGRVEDFLKTNDCEATAEDVMKYVNGIREGSVTDDDLDKVAGGTCSSLTCNCTTLTCGCF